MSKYIKELHVSFGDYSYRYSVGASYAPSASDVSEITKIKFNQTDTINYDVMTFDIYARLPLKDDKEKIVKKIKGLPVEITYGYE